MLKIKKETADIWEYKVGSNANIATFVHLWKTRLPLFDGLCGLAISVKSFRSICYIEVSRNVGSVNGLVIPGVTDGIQIKFRPGDFGGKNLVLHIYF